MKILILIFLSLGVYSEQDESNDEQMPSYDINILKGEEANCIPHYPLHPGPVVRPCEDNPSTKNVIESGYHCYTPGISTCDGSCYERENDLCPSGDGHPTCCYGGEKVTGEKWTPEVECFRNAFGLAASEFSEDNNFCPQQIFLLIDDSSRWWFTHPY